jgi:diguanylate cyclase (GGDEF)-like protein
MQKSEWSSFRITLMLYIVVFILPINFYFVYTAFNSVKHDTETVNQIGWAGGAIQYLAAHPSDKGAQQLIEEIDTKLHNMEKWISDNKDSGYYVGGHTLLADYAEVLSCWKSYKQEYLHADISAELSSKCWENTSDLAVVIEKMAYFKHNKITNSLYFNLTIIAIIILLIIYFVRTYIHIQMKKHAIYDLATKLFNKNYFLSQINMTCARSDRYGYPLSMIAVRINAFDTIEQTNGKSDKKHFLEMLGGLIRSLTRTSDIACRYSEDVFFIILPDTNADNAGIVQNRMKEMLDTHDFMTNKPVVFDVSVEEYQQKEQADKFIERMKRTLP